MIKLNLLPKEYKKAKKKKKKEAKEVVKFNLDFSKFAPKLFKIGIVFVAILIGTHLILGATFLISNSSAGKLSAEWELLQPKSAEISKVNKEIADIEKIVSPVRKLIKRECLWSKKLSLISDLITPGIWFNRLALEKRPDKTKKSGYVTVVELYGYAASSYGDETGIIGKFAKVLQENEDFFQDFSDIKLGPMQKTQLGGHQAMSFKVYCYLKDD